MVLSLLDCNNLLKVLKLFFCQFPSWEATKLQKVVIAVSVMGFFWMMCFSASALSVERLVPLRLIAHSVRDEAEEEVILC